MADKKEVTKVGRTSAGLRDAIFDELDAIRSGESNPTRANAVAKLAGSIVETVRMEVEVQRHVQQQSSPAKKAPALDDGFSMAFMLGQAD